VGLRKMPENRNLRMTYDRGELEIMSPSRHHELIAELLNNTTAHFGFYLG
jgi:hypothetical protein